MTEKNVVLLSTIFLSYIFVAVIIAEGGDVFRHAPSQKLQRLSFCN